MLTFFGPIKRPLGPNDRRRVACHEAGHAFAAILLKTRFEYVTIRPAGAGLSGHCKMNAAVRIRMFRETTSGSFVRNDIGEVRVRSREIRIDLGGIAGEVIGCGGFYLDVRSPDVVGAVSHARHLTRKLRKVPKPRGHFDSLFAPVQM